MKQPSELKQGQSALSPYQREISIALETIAALNPKRGHTISETALIIRNTKGLHKALSIDAFRTALQLLTDRGIASPVTRKTGVRVTTLWEVHEPFTPADISGLIEWSGLDADCFDEEGDPN